MLLFRQNKDEQALSDLKGLVLSIVSLYALL